MKRPLPETEDFTLNMDVAGLVGLDFLRRNECLVVVLEREERCSALEADRVNGEYISDEAIVLADRWEKRLRTDLG